jgi:hypothetical protein
MTQTDLSDVHSMTPMEAGEAAAGLCEMTADRQTDRQVLISLAACLASSRRAALPCWRVVISETDRASLAEGGEHSITLSGEEPSSMPKQKMPYLHGGSPGYDTLLLIGGCRRVGENVYPLS